MGKAEATTCCAQEEPESGFRRHQQKAPLELGKGQQRRRVHTIQNLRRPRLQCHQESTLDEVPEPLPPNPKGPGVEE